MRVITANVNGIRAAARRGGLDWLRDADPDVLCLQEVRASDDQLAGALAEGGFDGWHLAHARCSTPGRAGVAVVSRAPHSRLRVELPGSEEFASCGRWVEADLEVGGRTVTVVSVYVHTGEAETERQEEKYRFLEAMTVRMAELAAEDAHVVVCGDVNVAHRQADLKNWKGNIGKAGFLPEEQAYLDKWLADSWVDVTRRAAGDVAGPYTWWSWRGKAFDNDAGWRIDYQLATAPLADRVTRTFVGRADTYAERWSDHAAVVADYDL
jgi:exodeoxyribonuclease-3